jgi:hypothetical protein
MGSKQGSSLALTRQRAMPDLNAREATNKVCRADLWADFNAFGVTMVNS